MVRTSFASLSTFVGPLLLAGTAHGNAFANYWDVQAPASPNYIKQANSTLVLPDAPNPVVNELALWCGMGMSNGDLVQAIALSYSGTSDGDPCGNIGSNWCVAASTLFDGNGYQSISSQTAVAYAGDQITMSYLYDEGTTNTDQFVYLNGNLVSTYQSSAGAHANGWGTAEECQDGTPCGTVPQHQWINTVFVLNEADENFGSTVGRNGVSGGDISTPDGGTTWYVSTITVGQHTFS